MRTEADIREELSNYESLYEQNFNAGINAKTDTEIQQTVFNCRRYNLKIQVLKWVLGEIDEA